MKERYYDSLHGFIHVTLEEKKLLEHPAFVRLNYLHQLGLAYLVYPGATHSRFEHSLGVMHIASKIYDQLFDRKDPILKQALRLGALCHDLGHLPFSHTLEDKLLPLHGHEGKTLEIILSLQDEPIFKSYESLYPGFLKLVIKIAVSPYNFLKFFPQDQYTDLEMLLSSIVSGDYFGADRIDYLIRDSRCTGVSVGLFDFPQLIEMLSIADLDEKPEVVLKEEGLHAAEGLLLARHYMHLRVYMHPAVLAYNEALRSFIDKTNDLDYESFAPEKYITFTDAYLTDHFIKASLDKSHKGYRDACILMKKTQKVKIKELSKPKKSPGPLLIMKSSGVVDKLYPAEFIKPLFS